MALDANSSTVSSLELNPNMPSLHEVEISKHVPPAASNRVVVIPKLSLEEHLNRTLSDVSAELSRSSMNSDMNLHAVTNPEIQQAQCECCGMSEDCTPTYIRMVRELFCGRLVCGLCAEAVKEERHWMGKEVPMEDALRVHMAVCVKFNQVARSNPALYLADALRELLKKDSVENGMRSNPNSPRGRSVTKSTISRSVSCVPAILRE